MSKSLTTGFHFIYLSCVGSLDSHFLLWWTTDEKKSDHQQKIQVETYGNLGWHGGDSFYQREFDAGFSVISGLGFYFSTLVKEVFFFESFNSFVVEYPKLLL